jgi:hypothetical protein
MLSVPAAIIGVAAYPIVSERAMPLPLALGAVGAAAVALVLRRQLRLLVALPLVAAFLPSPQVGFVAYLEALAYFAAEHGAARLALRLDRVDGALLAVLGWAVMSWLANLGGETDAWSLPVFAITFLAPWLLLFLARAAPWTTTDLVTLVGMWLAAALAQLVPALLKPLAIGEPSMYTVPLVAFQLTGAALLRNFVPGGSSDLTTGTMISAHHFGVVLLLTIALILAMRMAVPGMRMRWLMFVVGFVFLMTDSKHIILAALPGTVLYGRVVVWPRLRAPTRRLVTAGAIVVGVGGTAYAGAAVSRFLVEGLWRPYMALASLNPKVVLYTRTAHRLADGSVQSWIGLGPGAYASRAASIRATSVLFKEQNRLPSFIPPFTSPAYAAVAYDLYTSSIVDTEHNRSVALTSPFSSLVGIVGEFGLLGSLVVLYFLGVMTEAAFGVWRRAALPPGLRAAGAAAGFAVPLLLFLGLFDTYFEQPDVTGPMVLLVLISLAAARVAAPGSRPDQAPVPTTRPR